VAATPGRAEGAQPATQGAVCHPKLQLRAIFPARENTVFLGGWIETAGARAHTLILKTSDRGQNWRQIGPRMEGSGIEAIEFIGDDTGWAAGERILDEPSDAFVLRTTDGGESWVKVELPSPTTSLGTIRTMSFTDSTHGTVVVDRRVGIRIRGRELDAEVFLTEDGGLTWKAADQLFRRKGEEEEREAIQEIERSGWKIVELEDGVFRIFRRGEKGWSAVATLDASSVDFDSRYLCGQDEKPE
jgi:photosystem II stability/assembly factor-like uncharacterized protein